jgi:hypothetical protein
MPLLSPSQSPSLLPSSIAIVIAVSSPLLSL